jgi:hypothetical protein
MQHQKMALPTLVFSVIIFSCNTSQTPIKKEQLEVQVANEKITNQAAFQLTSFKTFNEQFVQSITQHFTADENKQTIVTGKQGLKVYVNPTVLETTDGKKVQGKIDIELVELTNSEALFKSNAATISNGRLLVSGGSYFIGMYCNGQRLVVKPNQQLQIQVPKFKKGSMELFYGDRNVDGNMNWERANIPLQSNNTINFVQQYAAYNPPFPDTVTAKKAIPVRNNILYSSLATEVGFVDKRMRLSDMIDTLQKNGVDKMIDTVLIAHKHYTFRDYSITNDIVFKYEMKYEKRYRIMSCAEIEREKDSLQKAKNEKLFRDAANAKYAEEWRKKNEENSLSSQLQQYYTTTGITTLGWINCDRFYNNPTTEIPVEIPVTINTPIQYFLIYKSFNGLMNGFFNSNTATNIIAKMPIGQTVTMVAFTKKDGITYQYSNDFTIEKNKKVTLAFTPISPEKLKKMFGDNTNI